ncbi:MAG: hypothetical protein HC815_40700 [Richelia sp. RM1_1_1]|nr:hypothetical protein [Richelia sp. RM1_1_1]
MTMLFDIEQYQQRDWDDVVVDPAWDDGSAFPDTNSKDSRQETAPLQVKTINLNQVFIPAYSDSNCLSPVLKTQALCFSSWRIKFSGYYYQPKSSVRYSHPLVYWGNNWQKFREVFEEHGVVYLPISPSNTQEVLGENISLSISPSTRLQGENQTEKYRSLLSSNSNTQVNNNQQVLGENILPPVSPSTQVEIENQTQEAKSSLSNDSNIQVSNNQQVLGENILPSNSPSTYRKHGEGSGNLYWGYANANSTKKKPIKQLYFEWEYGGKRGKTYVRSHLKEQVISMNEAKVPVIQILKILTYNPKVARILGVN